MPAYKPQKPVYKGKWQTVRRKILERDGHTCQIGLLGCTVTATCVDHITPVSWGGGWYDDTNLRAACHNCNTALGALAQKHAPPKKTSSSTPGNTPERECAETALKRRLTAEPSRDW